jgi:hypothetical protein
MVPDGHSGRPCDRCSTDYSVWNQYQIQPNIHYGADRNVHDYTQRENAESAEQDLEFRSEELQIRATPQQQRDCDRYPAKSERPDRVTLKVGRHLHFRTGCETRRQADDGAHVPRRERSPKHRERR